MQRQHRGENGSVYGEEFGFKQLNEQLFSEVNFYGGLAFCGMRNIQVFITKIFQTADSKIGNTF